MTGESQAGLPLEAKPDAPTKPQAGRRQRAYAALSSAGLLAARVSALRDLTRRICSSAVSAANVASYATGQETEQRRGA